MSVGKARKISLSRPEGIPGCFKTGVLVVAQSVRDHGGEHSELSDRRVSRAAQVSLTTSTQGNH